MIWFIHFSPSFFSPSWKLTQLAKICESPSLINTEHINELVNCCCIETTQHCLYLVFMETTIMVFSPSREGCFVSICNPGLANTRTLDSQVLGQEGNRSCSLTSGITHIHVQLFAHYCPFFQHQCFPGYSLPFWRCGLQPLLLDTQIVFGCSKTYFV